MKRYAVLFAFILASPGCSSGPADAPPVAQPPAPADRGTRRLSQDLPSLIVGLGSSEPSIRLSAASGLAQMGPNAEPAMPFLITALEDESDDVSSRAAEALGSIGPSAADALPWLVRLLESPSSERRRGAAWAIGRLGPGSSLVPALVAASRTEDHGAGARAAAITALGRTGTTDQAALTELVSAMANSDRRVREAALGALSQHASLPDEIVVELALLLERGDAVERRRVARLLGSLKSGAALPTLYGALREPDLVRDATAAIVAIRTP